MRQENAGRAAADTVKKIKRIMTFAGIAEVL